MLCQTNKGKTFLYEDVDVPDRHKFRGYFKSRQAMLEQRQAVGQTRRQMPG